MTTPNIGRLDDATLRSIVDRLAALHRAIPNDPVVQVADAGAIERLRRIDIPAAGRPLNDVVDEMLQHIYPYRMRMDHPRCFAFVPSPTSALAWLGDLLTGAQIGRAHV